MSSKLHRVISCFEYCFDAVRQYLHPPALLSTYRSEIKVNILMSSLPN